MKIYRIINILTVVLIVTMNGLVKAGNINLNKTFKNDSIIYIFDKITSLNNLKLDATINMSNERSLIRVVLGCSDKKEYLVYEAYSPLVDVGVIQINSEMDETEFLNNVSPAYIKILINEAEITIKSFNFESNKNLKFSEIDKNNSLISKQTEKVNKLNQNLIAKNKKWRAGSNDDLLKMSYMDKKIYFGVEKYNSLGMEYYNGGIFEFPDFDLKNKSNLSKVKSSVRSELLSSYIDHFDWREKHGANISSSPYYVGTINGWVSPIKDQWAGTCWAYSAVGATETLVNLYYNQCLNLDLSEHEIVSCTGGGNTSSGGWPAPALEYIKNTGVVNESCFPNPTDEITLSCSNKCSNPTEKIKIGSYSYGGFSNEDDLKGLIIKTPMTFAIMSSYMSHAIVLVGYMTLKEGDVVWQNSNSQYPNITIQAGDPLIGKICWIIKDSRYNATTLGYKYFVFDNFYDISTYGTCSVFGNITSLQLTDNDIKCVDLDGDGYYNWGIGPKPANCPACISDEEDGDDSNPNLGPMDEYGFCRQLTTPLTYSGTSITSNATWNTKQILCGDLVVSNGATLTITNQLTMPVFSSITLQGNSKLIVDGGKITYANIIVNSGSELDLQNNGILELFKNNELSIDTGAIFNHTYGEVKMLNTY